jgi:predicted transcriptional regulator YdeE
MKISNEKLLETDGWIYGQNFEAYLYRHHSLPHEIYKSGVIYEGNIYEIEVYEDEENFYEDIE